MNPVVQKKEIALLGGAFNPVTRGHIQIAEYVLENSGIFDEVWLMPCFSHAYNKEMTGSEHRLAMCQIATSANPRIKVFDYEIKNRLTSGTYYVIKQLLEEDFSRQKYNYSMIIGQDNANTFHYWIKCDLLLKLIRFVVVPRKGIAVDNQVNWYLEPPHIYLTRDCYIMEISSTQVRAMLKQKEVVHITRYIDPGVLNYIEEHKLYK